MMFTKLEVFIMCLFTCAYLWTCGRIGEEFDSYWENQRYDHPRDIRQQGPDWQKKGIPAAQKIPQNNTYLKYEVDMLVKKYAKKYGHSPALIQSLIKYESLRAVGGDYAKARVVRSHAGAVGFMQIMPIHARLRGLPVSALENTDLNIKLGCSILAEQKRIAQSRGLRNITAEALRQYNQGAGSKKNWIAHRAGYKNWFKYVYPIIEESEVMVCRY